MRIIKKVIRLVIQFILYKSILKYVFTQPVQINFEEKKLIRLFVKHKLPEDSKILDIGCGFGGKCFLLQSLGFDVTGIDANPEIISANLKKGLNCMTVEQFEKTTTVYDILLMSHIIEHFEPSELLNFIDAYLSRLRDGGHLIILTPLYTSRFYDDFDHIKPYHPVGFHMVFGGNKAQVQYYARHKLRLNDLEFRKGPFLLSYCKGLYFYRYTSLPVIINNISAIMFKLSCGIIGKTTGWIGLYKKLN